MYLDYYPLVDFTLIALGTAIVIALFVSVVVGAIAYVVRPKARAR